MDFNTLKHRFDWFKEEARRLDKISERLACEKQNVEGIHLRMTNAYFRSLQGKYDRLHGALVDGKGSLNEGASILDNYSDSIRQTGRAYLQQEAANEEDAARIKKTMDDEGF